MSTPMPPTGPSGPVQARPGRKLGPITTQTGPAHRAWLQPLREAYLASGTTIEQLERGTGWSRSKISELLRAAGRYPRWEFIRDLLNALDLPATSVVTLRGMWVLAAREANKRTVWINSCVVKDIPDSERPVHFSAFQELYSATYFGYARTFLRRHTEAHRAVNDVFTLLLIIWAEALASANPERFAWHLMRETIMERTPHTDGHPNLVEASFESVALRQAPDNDTRLQQLEETMALFQAVRRLPPDQLDVMVLLHLRGLQETAVADVLGLSVASIRSTERHAKRSLDNRLFPNRTTQEGHRGDLTN